MKTQLPVCVRPTDLEINTKAAMRDLEELLRGLRLTGAPILAQSSNMRTDMCERLCAAQFILNGLSREWPLGFAQQDILRAYTQQCRRLADSLV